MHGPTTISLKKFNVKFEIRLKFIHSLWADNGQSAQETQFKTQFCQYPLISLGWVRKYFYEMVLWVDTLDTDQGLRSCWSWRNSCSSPVTFSLQNYTKPCPALSCDCVNCMFTLWNWIINQLSECDVCSTLRGLKTWH